MDKQKIFNNMVEDILSMVTIEKLDSGELISDKDNILINSNGKIDYLVNVPYKIEDNKIHGNTRNCLAKEFVKQYTFNDLKKLYNDKMATQKLHLQLEEKNKYKLDDLLPLISYINKYNNDRCNPTIEVRFTYGGFQKYMIEIDCNKNNYSSDNIQISNSSNYDKFEFRFNCKSEMLTKDEVIKRINKLSQIYEKVFQENKRAEELAQKKQDRKIDFEKKVIELYYSKKRILLHWNNSYMVYNHGCRYAVGRGKSGRYYNCNYNQFYKMMTSKNINKYCVIDQKLDYTELNDKITNKELQFKEIA